ncbi:MAG: sensor histidine kinase, partial [bacterium]
LKMTQMMENVLILGNIESGLLGFNKDKFNLDAFCKSVAKNTEINFHNKVFVKYWYLASDKDYILDENLTGLIVTHLLSNAVKYSKKGTEQLVEFKITSDENNIHFDITDEGIGIPQKDIPYLFKEFFRASNTGSISGYGLGLTIVKRAVESHKGKIYIKSILNKGTQVKVTLPIL